MNTPANAARGEKVGRAGRTLGQLWQVPTFLLGLLALGAVAASAPLRHPPQWWEFEATVTALRRGLDQGEDAAALVALAENALVKLPEFERRAAEVHFLAGSVYARQAAQQPVPRRAETYARAAEHLQKALQLGPDERDLPRAQYRLGWCLYHQGQDLPRALELMSGAADKGAEQRLAGYQFLVQAYQKLSAPNLPAALTASEKVLELTDDRDADAMAQARLVHADLLLRLEKRADALRELERIGPKASPSLRLKARLLQVRLCEDEGLWAKAIPLWQELLEAGDEVPGGRTRVCFELGKCFMRLEVPDEAAAVRAWKEARQLGGEPGQAAALRLGELYLFGAAPDVVKALEAWREVLASVPSADEYRNAHAPLEQFRALFDRALDHFLNCQDYEQVQQFAALYRPIAPPGVADAKLARAAEAQAKKQQADAGAKADDVRALFRRAGEAYTQSASARTDKERGKTLWAGARCFLAAHDVERAADVMKQFDRLDREDVRLAEGWYRLAELYRAEGKQDESRAAYHHSMQYAESPFAARSRYYLALDEVAKKDWKKAEEILQQNLNLAGPALDREAHEKSLYKLAWVVYQARDYGRAEFFLKQAAGRYPANANALIVRDHLGDCYRRLAEQASHKELEQRKALKPNLPPEGRSQLEEGVRHHQQTRRKWLRESAGVYQALADELTERGRDRALTDLEATLLRRALLGTAENHADLAEYGDALRAYQDLLRRHRGRIETLIACERICALLRLVSEPDQRRELTAAARQALTQAEEDLKKLDPQGPDFQGPDVWTWQRWQEWLRGARAALDVPPVPPAEPKGPAVQ